MTPGVLGPAGEDGEGAAYSAGSEHETGGGKLKSAEGMLTGGHAIGPCGPASAQRSLARRALPLGWAIGGAGGLVQAPPRRLQPDGPRRSFASGQAPASLSLNLTLPVPWRSFGQ